ncbi:ferredoxin [Methanocella sp. CWC-04]|uniref:Ferredoxin n=1 Tax=Methanooceanicella nereidis TaxID=2052831 RepID=A0AAP2RAH1_9EURY|nr:ferredoxin [Methanocella sp. CWC-04]
MIAVNRFKCGYCGGCVAVCPKNAITLVETFISIDEECIDCGKCLKACPMGAMEKISYER